jgi:excisionase family DNA binding protein
MNNFDRIYTIKEVSEMLSLPEKTIKSAISMRELECYKFGTKRFTTRISAKALEKWLERTKQKGIIR